MPMVRDKLCGGGFSGARRSLIIPNTNAWPDIQFPLWDDNGIPRRPGSVLCVPIFEPAPADGSGKSSAAGTVPEERDGFASQRILGAIEVYHRRARGLPIAEVELLEQFAQQVGFAIQDAR